MQSISNSHTKAGTALPAMTTALEDGDRQLSGAPGMVRDTVSKTKVKRLER